MAGVPSTIYHNPGDNTKATISKAAPAAQSRHVVTALSAKLCAGGTAPTAATATLNLRAGLTGAGNVITSWPLSVPAVAGSPGDAVTLSGVEIYGEPGAAICLEFTAASGSNTLQSVMLTIETR